MDKITIKNMKFHAFHGVYPEEQAQGQNFYIDVELYTDLQKAGRTDCLEDTIDYSAVYEIVRDINMNRKFKLIERLADEICRRVLLQYGAAAEVAVCVRKPEAPIEGVFDWVSVEMKRSRDEL